MRSAPWAKSRLGSTLSIAAGCLPNREGLVPSQLPNREGLVPSQRPASLLRGMQNNCDACIKAAHSPTGDGGERVDEIGRYGPRRCSRRGSCELGTPASFVGGWSEGIRGIMWATFGLFLDFSNYKCTRKEKKETTYSESYVRFEAA
jgi:hypothetical protein